MPSKKPKIKRRKIPKTDKQTQPNNQPPSIDKNPTKKPSSNTRSRSILPKNRSPQPTRPTTQANNPPNKATNNQPQNKQPTGSSTSPTSISGLGNSITSGINNTIKQAGIGSVIIGLISGLGLGGSMLYAIHSAITHYGPSGGSGKQTTMITAQVDPVSTPTGLPGNVTTTNTNFQQAPNEPIFYYIKNAPDESVSSSFKNWAGQIENMDKEIISLAKEEIQKTDTSEETIELLQKQHQIYTKVADYADHASQQNDEKTYYSYLYNHYSGQENVVVNLAFFNEIFEYLLMQTGQGAEINGNLVEDQELRSSRRSNLEEMMQLAVDYKTELIENDQNLSEESKQKKKEQLQQKLELTTGTIEEETEERDEKFPPALQFYNPNELSILLPQTKSDYDQYTGKNVVVDARVYYLLNYIYHVLEMTGEDYEIYKQNVTQEASTPADLETFCGDSLENDPEICPINWLVCGLDRNLYASKWLTGQIDNLGVPYKDRAYLKIWLGQNSPDETDELPSDQQDNQIEIYNTHIDFRAIDIGQIGLYNPRLDCAGCKGLEKCAPNCLTQTPPPPEPCCPELPFALDSAEDTYLPVEVEWSHGDIKADALTGAATSFFGAGNINQFSLQGLAGQFSGAALGSIAGFDLSGNFDYFDIINGSTSDIFSHIGDGFINNIFGQIGLPSNIANIINNNHLDNASGWLGIGSGYINDYLGFENQFTPVVAAITSGDFNQVAQNILEYSDLNLPPILHNSINAAINQDPNLAADLSFANIGIQEINNFFGWPQGTIDISTFAQNGINNLTYRLGQSTLYKTQGLPADKNSYDPENTKNNYQTMATNIISQITGNQKIANYSTSTIEQSNPIKLYEVMRLLSTKDLAILFNLSGDKQETAETIYNYIQSPQDYPGGHDLFLRNISADIDYQTITNTHSDLTTDSARILVEKGTSPELGDEFALARIGLEPMFANSGIDLTDLEKDQVTYLLELIAIENLYPNTITNNYNNQLFQPIEAINLQTEYMQKLNTSETLANFRQRLIDKIDSASISNQETIKTITAYQNTTLPIRIQFGQSNVLNRFLNELKTNRDLSEYTFNDVSTLPHPTNSGSYITISNTLSEIELELESLNIVSSQSISNQAGNVTTGHPTNSTITFTGQEYYLSPKIDLAEILVPGIRTNSNYTNQIGNFKYLETATNIIHNSYQYPVIIQIREKDAITPLNIISNQNEAVANLFGLPPQSSALEIAMAAKYVLVSNTAEGANQQQDLLAQLGGTSHIFNSLNSISPDNSQQTTTNFAQIGYTTTAARMTGLDLTGFTNINTDSAEIENFINTVGILKSLPDQDVQRGINEAVGLVEQNNVFKNISQINNSIDVSSAISNIQNGNYQELLGNIPSVQNNISNKFPQLNNVPVSDIFTNIQQPSVNGMMNLSQSFMANTVSGQTGLDALGTFDMISQDLGGYPPKISNIPNLLSNPTIQDKLLNDIDPQILNGIPDLYSNLLSGNISPDNLTSFIGQNQLFSQMIDQDQFNDFLGQYGGFLDAALNMDPDAIAQNALNYFQDDITDWLQMNGISDYLNLGDLQNLINGDISSFINNTAANFIDSQYLTQFQDLVGPIQNLLDGNISFGSMIGLINGLDSMFGDLSIDGDITGGMDDIKDLIKGKIPLGLQDLFNQLAPDIVFAVCRQKIAQDNIIHLTDIISSFDTNKRTLNIYNINYNGDGQLTDEDEKNPDLVLSQFFPHQVFSDWAEKVLDIISEKAAETFNYVWPKDPQGISQINGNNDIWTNDCSNRDNDYLANCKQYIHVGF